MTQEKGSVTSTLSPTDDQCSGDAYYGRCETPSVYRAGDAYACGLHISRILNLLLKTGESVVVERVWQR
jgi:hypothetical protein